MKILITGANGFIGKHVLNILRNDNYEIVATFPEEEKHQHKELIKEFHYIPYNFNDILSKEENLFTKFLEPDVLIHLAWQGLPNFKNQTHVEETLPIQIKVIGNLIKNGLKNINITGTCQEYGMSNGCLDENMVVNPETQYAIAKDTLRKYTQNLCKEYNATLKWIRLFYMYGEGQNSKSIIPQLIKAINNNESMFKMSGGEQIRDYLPIEKVAEYIIKISIQNNVNGIINCCSGDPLSIRTLVEKQIDKYNSTIKLNLGHYPYPDYEPFAFWGCTKN